MSATEIEDLLAFAGALVGDRPLTEAERDHLREHIERRLTDASGDALKLYRTTVRLLNGTAGARFSTLAPDARGGLIARHRLGSPRLRTDETPGDDVRDVRARAVPDLIGAYYSSAAGWAVVGYTTFPGRCGDLGRYTAPEPPRSSSPVPPTIRPGGASGRTG